LQCEGVIARLLEQCLEFPASLLTRAIRPPGTWSTILSGKGQQRAPSDECAPGLFDASLGRFSESVFGAQLLLQRGGLLPRRPSVFILVRQPSL
jgi:hypothetical protein